MAISDAAQEPSDARRAYSWAIDNILEAIPRDFPKILPGLATESVEAAVFSRHGDLPFALLCSTHLVFGVAVNTQLAVVDRSKCRVLRLDTGWLGKKKRAGDWHKAPAPEMKLQLAGSVHTMLFDTWVPQYDNLKARLDGFAKHLKKKGS
jgi:hypothetical protein